MHTSLRRSGEPMSSRSEFGCATGVTFPPDRDEQARHSLACRTPLIQATATRVRPTDGSAAFFMILDMDSEGWHAEVTAPQATSVRCDAKNHAFGSKVSKAGQGRVSLLTRRNSQ